MVKVSTVDKMESLTKYFTSKEIMTFYVAHPSDSYFVEGVPPIEMVEVVPYNHLWPNIYENIASIIKQKLGVNVEAIDHIGSTAIPEIAAKPIIDIDLSVCDSENEQCYLPALEELGFKLVVREPRFYGHRLFHLENPRVNLHVFTFRSPEAIRHLLFRNWLRESEEDRQVYINAKLDAVKGCELDIEKYHKNKQDMVHYIYQKIFQALGFINVEDEHEISKFK